MASKTIRHLLTGFIAGEISPMLFGRVDTDQYAFGVERCENFVAVNEGPLVKRPGFEMIRAAAPDSTWLSAFRFSVTQEYGLEWRDFAVRFYTNGGRVETSDNIPYECPVPFTGAEAPALSVQQSYDRLYVDHRAHPPGRLTRTSAVTFSWETSALVNGPFSDGNADETATVTVSGTDKGSSVSVSATAPIFRPGHVGALFRIEARDFSTTPAWEPGMKDIAVGYMVRSDGKVYRALTSGKTGTITPTHDDGAAWDGSQKNDELNNHGPWGVQWQYVHDRFGIGRITAVDGSGAGATMTVLRQLPASLTSVASWRWSHGLFSDDAGYPAIVVHWQGRQVHIKDFDVVGSVAGDFLNYAAYTSSGILAADMSFRRRLATEDPPLWALADRQLLLGSATKELAVGAVNTQAAVSGDNIKSEPQSFYGSAPVTPVQLGSEAIFVERGRRRLRSTSYEFSSDRYQAVDLTAAARHVTDGGIVQLAVQRWPWTMLHAVRRDGQMVCHAINRGDVKGFSRIVLGGGAKVLSAVSIMGDDGETDDLWVLVSRETPGGTRREIWKQHAWRELGDPQADAFYVDGGVQIAAAAGQAHFSNLTHLAGQAVAVLADGAVIPDMAVADDGTLTLPDAYVPAQPYTLAVGLAYSAVAVTLRPAPRNASGLIQGLRQRVVTAIVRVLDTLGIRGGGAGPDDGDYDLIDRPGSAAMNKAIPLASGDLNVSIDMDPGDLGQLRFTSSDPLPAMVAMVSMKLEAGED